MAQPQLGSQVAVPTLKNSVGTEITNLAATETGYFDFGGFVQRFTIVNDTGNSVYLKYRVASLTPAVSVDWFHQIVPAGMPCDFNIAVDTIGIYVPAGGTTLEYKSLTKNFSVVGYNKMKAN